MTQSDEPKDLKKNWVDYSVAGARGTVNLVPIVGPLFAEIFGTTIPNQRMDRIAKFAAELESRIERLENEPSEAQFNCEEFTDILEEGFRQAARSLSDERRSYIGTLIVNGLSSEDIELAESRHLLRMLGELTDVEVVWLRYYREPTMVGDENFRKAHETILTPVLATLGSSKDTLYKEALQESYQEHLAQLGLLDRRFRTDIRTQTPEFDSFSGAMEVAGYDLTNLGRLLLREIGLGADE